MKIQILGIGKVREPFYRAGIEDYLGRLGRYVKVEVFEAPRERSGGREDLEAAYSRVRDRHLKAAVRVALDENGEQMTSTRLAGWIEDMRASGHAAVSFVAGGAHGLAGTALADSSKVLSLSSMTLPHQMARMVLAEQLYRAFTILKGEPYHK